MSLHQPILQYNEPEWSRVPHSKQSQWEVEVLKNGVVVETRPLPVDCSFLTVGRLPICDLSLEHPSVSRYHAILQYRDDGRLFLYDLGSAHGTRLNKQLVPVRTYQEIITGSFVVFGASTRSYVFLTSQSNISQYEDPKLSIGEEEEMTWGISYDDDDGEDRRHDSARMLNESAAYRKDPLKYLRNWYEQLDLDWPIIECEEEGKGQNKRFITRMVLELPNSGRTIDITGSGLHKKQAESELALQACLYLDQLGMLRAAGSSMGSTKRRRFVKQDNDDDDDYYDRTAKKSTTLNKKAQSKQHVETYQSLAKRKLELEHELLLLEENIQSEQSEKTLDRADGDELVEYMASVEAQMQKDKSETYAKQKSILIEELERITQLFQIAKPVGCDLFQQQKLLPSKHPSLKNKEEQFGLLSKAQVKPEVTSAAADLSSLPPTRQRSPSPKIQATAAERRIFGPMMMPEGYQPKDEQDAHFAETDDDIDEWVPPSDQHGDGSTALNKKFGY